MIAKRTVPSFTLSSITGDQEVSFQVRVFLTMKLELALTLADFVLDHKFQNKALQALALQIVNDHVDADLVEADLDPDLALALGNNILDAECPNKALQALAWKLVGHSAPRDVIKGEETEEEENSEE